MLGQRSKCLAVAAALALSGCSYGNDLLDWATGSTPAASSSTTVPIAPSAAESNPQPTITASPLAGATAASAPAGTFVGQKAQALATELGQLQSNLVQHQQAMQSARQSESADASAYYGLVAGINSRLQVGTTPGNPQLVAQWGQAQSALDRMTADLAQLNAISNQAAADSSFGNYLLGEVRSAYTLQGGVDADRDRLRQIETQTIAALNASDQLLSSLGDEISRQSGNVANERNNLVTLALAIQNGQLYGPSLANRNLGATSAPAAASAPAPPRARAAPAPAAAKATDDRPLVVIRFDQPNVTYDQPLYSAVSRALERKANATFTIMAVSPNAGTPAEVAVNTNTSRQNAENVLHSLTSMGLPADRISLAAATSPDVQGNEVRIFVH